MKKCLLSLAVIPFTLLACNVASELPEDNYLSYKRTIDGNDDYEESKTYNKDGIEIKCVFSDYPDGILYESGERNFDIESLTAMTNSTYYYTDRSELGNRQLTEKYNENLLISHREETNNVGDISKFNEYYEYNDKNLLVNINSTYTFKDPEYILETLTHYEYDDNNRLVKSSVSDASSNNDSYIETSYEYELDYLNPKTINVHINDDGEHIFYETINLLDDKGNIVASDTKMSIGEEDFYLIESSAFEYKNNRVTNEITDYYSNENSKVYKTQYIEYTRDKHNRKTQVKTYYDPSDTVTIETYTY